MNIKWCVVTPEESARVAPEASEAVIDGRATGNCVGAAIAPSNYRAALQACVAFHRRHGKTLTGCIDWDDHSRRIYLTFMSHVSLDEARRALRQALAAQAPPPQPKGVEHEHTG